MATEAVKILIEAEDLASSKVAQAANKIDQNVKKIKDVGGKAKASTEFIGQLSNQLGGSALGSYASQLAGLTEKVGQFAEVSKLGGAGALAFKTGLVGLVGVLSFNVGNAIGNWFFETEKWNKELEDAIANSDRLTSKISELNNLRINESLSDIGNLGTFEQQRDSLSQLIEQVKKEQVNFNKNVEEIKKSKPKVETWDMGMLARLGIDTANEKARKATDELVQQNLKVSQAYTDQIIALQRRESQLDKIIAKEKEATEAASLASGNAFNESLEKEYNLLVAQGDEVFTLRAEYAGLTGDMAKQASFLMRMIDAEKKRQEAAKKAEDEKQRDQDRIAAQEERNAEFLKSEIDSLKERNVLITQGTKAAEVFRLTNRGIAQEDAEMLANERDRLDKLEREKNSAQSEKPALQAVQSRTLMRGSSEGFQVKIADSTKKASDILAEIKILQQELITATKEKKPVEINLEQR